jgi:hypothetical protein
MSTLKVNNIQPYSGTTVTVNSLNATGSFSGSLVGNSLTATTASFALTGDGVFSGSFSGSYQGDGSALTGVSAVTFPYTGSAAISGSLTVNGPSTATSFTSSVGRFATARNFGQTQWSRTLTSTVNLPNGTTANGFEFFTDANKVTAGTTSYDEYFIGYGNDLTLTGTSGTALINISGSDYPISFDTSLQTTADNFVAASSSILLSLYDISVNSPGSNILRFGNGNQTTINNITITNQTGNLSGTLTGASNNHVRIPYLGTPYEGQRLTHNFRVNFNIEAGSTQTFALSLRRFTDDTIIGTEIPVLRNADEPGQQFNFNSYTAGSTDPFVQGGFYFALRNDSGTSVVYISGSVGILVQTYYESPTTF